MNLGADVLNLPSGLVLKVTIAPQEEAASLKTAQTFARIDTGSDDTLLKELLASATEKAEAYINRKLINQTIQAHWEIGADRITLPFGNVQSVTKVEIGQTDGTFIEDTTFVLKANTVFLTNSLDSTGENVRITYITGFGDSSDKVPAVIREAIYKMIITSYDNREDLIMGESVMMMPNSSKRELAQFINYESF